MTIDRRTLLVSSLAAFLLLGSPDTAAAQATFTVNVTEDVDDGACDAGHCSLREAIQAANATAGSDLIAFTIPASTDPGCDSTTGVCTIEPTSQLPSITDPVTIDGYTQTGSSPNTNGVDEGIDANLTVELSGSAAGSAHGLQVLRTDDSVIRGLVINRFERSGIRIQRGNGNRIEGNFIGTDVAGATDLGNGADGVAIFGAFHELTAGLNVVGGTSPAARNVISGNTSSGVLIFNGKGVIGGGFVGGNSVRGNLIGTDASGTAAVGNGVGVRLIRESRRTGVGTRSLAGGRNVISGNGVGVHISGTQTRSNQVYRNYIGSDVTGEPNLPNGTGVIIADLARSNTLGSNLIAGNTGDGVRILSDAHSNDLSANSIHSNGELGIDLGGDGVTPNDPADEDLGPNFLQNYPELSRALSGGGETTVHGTFNGRTNWFIKLQLFSSPACDPSGHGEGRTFLGSLRVDTDPDGDAEFTHTLPESVPTGHVVTATAGDGSVVSTSEFSECVEVNVVTVNSTNVPGGQDGVCDAEECTLAEAVELANSVPGEQRIEFDIPVDSDPGCEAATGVCTLEFRASGGLPIVTEPVVVDGYTQPGATPNTLPAPGPMDAKPRIVLDGSEITSGDAGLELTGGGSTVRGLVIQEFSDGIRISGPGGNVVQGNFLGTDASGTVAAGNTVGVVVDGSPDNTVGGATPAARNLIARHASAAVEISGPGATGNALQGNLIGTDLGGVDPLGLSDQATIYIESASDNLIGGADPAAGNVIAHSGLIAGLIIIEFNGNRATGNAIRSNRFFSNGGPGIDLNADGPTVNDDGDGDVGPNEYQNFPVLGVSTVTPDPSTTIRGALSSAASTTFELDFFSSSVCDEREGETLIGSATVTTDGGGDVSFSETFATAVSDGSALTATATDPSGNTSEFSECQPAVVDSDGDGIADAVDTDPATPSDAFSDAPAGGTTDGTIADRGDQVLGVVDWPSPDGVLVFADPSGGSAQATITVCGGTETWTLGAGDEMILTCGSTTAEVRKGPVEAALSPDVTLVVPTGTTMTLTELTLGRFDVRVATESAGSVSVEIGGVAVESIAPGESRSLAPLAIDLKPGGDPASVNCRNPNGVLPVAILTTPTFDATAVDHRTVAFGRTGTEAAEIHRRGRKGAKEVTRHEEDVDGDGDTDLLFHFRFGETGLDCEHPGGLLVGRTTDGSLVAGSASIRSVSPASTSRPPTEPLVLPSTVTATGGAAQFEVVLRGDGVFAGAEVELGCSGLPAGVSCSFDPGVLRPGPDDAASRLTVSIRRPTAAVSLPAVPAPWRVPVGAALLAGALALLPLLSGRRDAEGRGRRPATPPLRALVVALAVALFVHGCSDGPTGPRGPETPPGEHEFTVTATTDGVESAATATLVVE